MFTLANRLLNRNLLLVAAAACGLTASAASAQPWGWGWHHSRRVVVVEPRPRVVVVNPQPTVVVTQPAVVVRPDVMPADLKMAAYQSGETVILTVSGTNGNGGYTTSLGGVDLNPWSPSVIVHNCAPPEACVAAQTPFSVTASIHASHALGAVTLRIGEQAYQVPVTQAVSLS